MKERLIQKMNSIIRSESSKQDITEKYKSPESRMDRQNIDSESIYYSMSEKKSLHHHNIKQENQTNMNVTLVQEYPSLKELGLNKNEIISGQQPVFVEENQVLCKFPLQYQKVLFIVTNFKLAFKPQKQDFMMFPIGKIERLEKYIEKGFKIFIKLKDGRVFKFRIVSENLWKKLYEILDIFSFVQNKNRFFAFRHFENNIALELKHNGWKIYDPIKEFQRMGLQLLRNPEQNPTQLNSDFKILDNSNGRICSTYPPIIVVPSRISDDSLIKCARFRSKQRLPAMTFAYRYETDKFSCIYRSSQSKVGIPNSRSCDDQAMLQLIGNPKLNLKSLQSSNEDKNCKIYDARNYMAAFGNKIAGKGFEQEQFYKNCSLTFLNIPNIHAVRQSYNKTIDASMGQDSKFYIGLAESKWYELVFLILYGAIDMAKALYNGINSLVHCSDGWDRTAQLCCLTSILLDPYYRTIQGFIVLIEKDWIYFGHQFGKRLGQGINDPTNEDRSQVFLQYLDCVTQIMYQFPSEFQFSYKLIEEIAEQAYSNLYGNFLCNCYLQMQRLQIFTKTVSLWSYIMENKQKFLNPFYLQIKKNLLTFQPNQKNMRFWKEHFLKHVDTFKDVYGIYSCKFTQNNLEIMHQHILQQKILLTEKCSDNESFLSSLECQINGHRSSNEFVAETEEIQIAFHKQQHEEA